MSPAFTTDLLRDDADRAGRLGGLFGRALPRRRSDLMMLLLAAAASGAVLVNALAFQDGSRPVASLLDQLIGTPPVPVPPAAPAEMRQAEAAPPAAPASESPQAAVTPAARPATPPLPRARPATPPASPTLASLAGQAATAAPPVRPPADVPASPRLMSVQKALAKIGYGPVRIDGRDSAATKAAIERFERDRRMPVTGVVSERLLRELTAVSGITVQ